jgi:uncharacterized Fe-S cluster-containing protein
MPRTLHRLWLDLREREDRKRALQQRKKISETTGITERQRKYDGILDYYFAQSPIVEGGEREREREREILYFLDGKE